MTDNETDSNNILQFPVEKLRSGANLQSQEEYLKMIEEYRTNFSEEITDMLASMVFGEMARSGVDFSKNIEELFPSMLLVVESIKALHLLSSKIHHPLQNFAQEVFDENDIEQILTSLEEEDIE